MKELATREAKIDRVASASECVSISLWKRLQKTCNQGYYKVYVVNKASYHIHFIVALVTCVSACKNTIYMT